MQKFFFGLLITFQLFIQAFGAEKVVLQLKWEHEFQFAGYYAAQWQGYYADLGIDVEIRPISREDGTIVSPVSEIKTGNAQFAIGSLNILIANDQGAELLVLAPIFQRSPYAVFSLSNTPIDNLSQLAKLRIAVVEGDTGKYEVDALFKSRGYDLDKIEFVYVPNTVESLLTNQADALVTYTISATIESKERGVTLNQLNPADYGINFYGDTLYTSQRLQTLNPELVSNFIQASKKGWQYALENKYEIAKRISEELPRHLFEYEDPYKYNMAFADLIDELMAYPEQEIGKINQQRWVSMNEKMRSLGLVYSRLNNYDFIYSSEKETTQISANILFFIALVILASLILFFWFKQYSTLTVVSILLLSFTINYHVEELLVKEFEQNEKLNLFQKLSSVTAKLEGNLQNNLSMLTGFAAYISAQPELTEKDFANYAREIFKKEPMLINFAAAKDLVINYIYPMQGNEKAIGLDYTKNESQKGMVMQVVNTGQLLVAGPVNLVQSGVAFIGRAPIYTGDGIDRRFWGIISAPLDTDSLYLHSDVLAVADEMNLAIRSFDPQGNKGPVFYGDESVFQASDNIKLIISVGGGTWHLAATPLKILTKSNTNIAVFNLVLIITTLILCAFTLLRIKQKKEKLSLQTTIINNQDLLENVGHVAKIGGWNLDSDLNFTQWSKQSSLLLGKPRDYRPQSLLQIAYLFEEDDFAMWKESIQRGLTSTDSSELEIKLKKGNQKNIWLRIIIRASTKDNEKAITGTMQDVTDKVLSAKTIERQATYDSLTNLPNRVLFNDRLTTSMQRAARKGSKIAVLFIDLDRFKPVNDNHGHQTGDKLLVEAANRISSCMRDSDTVSRLSGDEFGAILSDIDNYVDVLMVSEKVHEIMQEPYNIDGKSLYCSASIGIAIYPADGDDAQSLIQKADQAMYEVKSSGRNGWQFYTKEMQSKSEYRHNLLNDLINAVAQNKLSAHYQPIIDLKSLQITKCESLSRWQKEDGTFIPPIEFINLAEESGLINKIDLSMLENSARVIRNIQQEIVNIGLTINVSPRLFHTKDKALENWLESIRVISQQIDITVEITERLLTNDSEKALSVLNTLKEFGVKIAIDDFGTGYSSLSYLVKFPVDIIKIDRSFIDSIGQESSAETLIETILLMAKRLDIQVVAEGIETQQQLDFLILHQCDFGQGYFLAKPMPLENLKSYIRSNIG